MPQEEYKRLVRLFLEGQTLSSGESISLSDTQAHYLRNVMRRSAGDRLRVFNGAEGEYLAEIKELNKKSGIINIVHQISQQKASPDIWILASPVKKEAFDLMIEKASELGPSKFIPVICDNTVVHRMNMGRAHAIAVEAAEQSERLDVLKIEDLLGLKDILKSWDKNRKLIFCFERGGAPVITEATKGLKGQSLAILIGPEGGFSPDEAKLLTGLDFVIPVSLGPRILRAETAMIAAISCVQAGAGDWI